MGPYAFADYRQVNAKTIKSGQPLNRIDDSLDALAGAKLFSVLDLRSGYWNVKIAEQDRKKNCLCYTRQWLMAI